MGSSVIGQSKTRSFRYMGRKRCLGRSASLGGSMEAAQSPLGHRDWTRMSEVRVFNRRDDRKVAKGRGSADHNKATGHRCPESSLPKGKGKP